jgi:hypothetical protein
MQICRLPNLWARGAWRWPGYLLLVGLTACGAADQGAANRALVTTPAAAPSATLEPLAAAATAVTSRSAEPTGAPVETPLPLVGAPPNGTPIEQIIHSATSVTAPTTSAATETWQTYRSVHAGYTVEYPAVWSVNEQVGTDGSVTTMFLPAGGAWVSL